MTHSLIALFISPLRAEKAVKRLRQHRLYPSQLSCLAKAGKEQELVGCYTDRDGLKCCARDSSFWSGLWAAGGGAAVLLIPGIGPIVIAGAIVKSIAQLEGAIVVGAMGILSASLYSLGIPDDYATSYLSALASDRVLMIVTGTASDVADAQVMIEPAMPLGVYAHSESDREELG